LPATVQKREVQIVALITCLAPCRNERYRLLQHWHETWRQTLTEQLSHWVKCYAEVKEELSQWYARVDVEVVREANVVCMTTNGVASRQKLIACMGPKVVPLLLAISPSCAPS
jgi:hypothetical protein